MITRKLMVISCLMLTLGIVLLSPAFAKKPPGNQKMEVLANEHETSVRKGNMRVSEESGAPLAIYRLNYTLKADTPENMARQYLKAQAKLFKIKADLSEARHYVTKQTPAGHHVRFQQYVAGYPLYRGDMVITINHQNKVVFVSSNFKPLARLDNPVARVSLDAAEQMAKSYLNIQGAIDLLKKETVVYYNKGVTRLAQKINIIPKEEMFGDWEVLIDAHTGEIFRVEDRAFYSGPRKSAVNGTGTVFDPDPLTSSGATYGDPGFTDGGDGDTPQLLGQIFTRDLLDITFDGVNFNLDGPYASIIDFESPFLGTFSQATDDWNFTRTESGFEAVNVYYHLDASMRYINETLNVPLTPFQYAGGVQGDPHGLNGADNSHYLPGSGRLAWGEGCVDDAEDADVILHELGHGIHDWLTNGNLSQVNGLSEGSGDYWANSYNRGKGFWTPADPQYWWVFQWDGHNECWGGRRTDYTATYPGGLIGQIHTDGQIWSSALMQIWDDIGKEACDKNFLVGLAMTTFNTNQEDAAQAFVQADIDNFGGANLTSILFWFTERGYDVSAPFLTFDMDLDDGWNMISAPYTLADNDYASNFPNATAPPFLFDGAYQGTNTMDPCIGYWLHNSAIETVTLPGVTVEECVLNLDTGWNLVGGPSCDVPIANIDDPNTIIQGQIFAFNGAYIEATTIEQGKAYWVNASEVGTITISCATVKTNKSAVAIRDRLELDQQSSIEINAANGAAQKLYFGVALPDDVKKDHFLMPPVPPNSIFDARISGDLKLTDAEEILIKVQASEFPLTIRFANLALEDGWQYKLEAMAGETVLEEYPVFEGQAITLTNSLAKTLKLSKVEGNLPIAFAVEQNYPNPFNPTTEIRYAIPATEKVSVVIYNSLGQAVKTLVSQTQESGSYTVTWNATNDNGIKVGSGVYFYMVKAGEHSAIRKMLLLK